MEARDRANISLPSHFSLLLPAQRLKTNTYSPPLLIDNTNKVVIVQMSFLIVKRVYTSARIDRNRITALRVKDNYAVTISERIQLTDAVGGWRERAPPARLIESIRVLSPIRKA